MADKSRAEYFRERRKDKKNFGALLDRSKVERMETKLKEIGSTKTEWLERKIDEELSKK